MKQVKNTKKTNLNKANFRNKNAITLIALVVTIVVLLILAGVTISLLLDENGIIAKSKYAKLENRASQVEDEIGMWKQNNFINKESGQTQEEADTMLASLISRKLLKEDEIDRENEVITIKKNDGSILKQISYSKVTINISKQPETEKSSAVLLTIDSVEGMTKFENEEEYNVFLNSLSEEQQKEIIRRIEPLCINKHEMQNNIKTQYTTFKEALEWHKKQGNIPNATEEEFWNRIENRDGITERLREDLYYISFEDADGRLICCMITNPDEETSNTYVATENGIYTFRIQDVVTGKTYTKKVEVTNIGENAKYYILNINEYDIINNNTAKITTRLASAKPLKLAVREVFWCTGLRDKETNSLQTFTKAYIIYNNQRVDISSIIEEKNGYNYIIGCDIANYLYERRENFNWDGFNDEEYQFIIEKDGVYYTGMAKVGPV